MILGLGGVNLHVRSQIGFIGERAGTVGIGTFERLLAGVRAHVTLQQPVAREDLAAGGTFVVVARTVRVGVVARRRVGDEQTVALGAAVGAMAARSAAVAQGHAMSARRAAVARGHALTAGRANVAVGRGETRH